MYKKRIKEKLEKELYKLYKKNHKIIDILNNNIEEILQNPHHYKPLRNNLKNKKRIQIGSYVLIFEINEEEKIITFLKFKHHDDVYENN